MGEMGQQPHLVTFPSLGPKRAGYPLHQLGGTPGVTTQYQFSLSSISIKDRACASLVSLSSLSLS